MYLPLHFRRTVDKADVLLKILFICVVNHLLIIKVKQKKHQPFMYTPLTAITLTAATPLVIC
jgi:hypothetical protein